MALILEQLAVDAGASGQHKVKRDIADCYDFEPETSNQQVNSVDYTYWSKLVTG